MPYYTAGALTATMATLLAYDCLVIELDFQTKDYRDLA